VSLTSELENPASRLSVFMDQELPGIGSFVKQAAHGQMIGTAID
jgi:hypothetical protein